MKKSVIHSTIFFFFLLAIFIPILKIAFAPAPPQIFNVMVNLGNVAPRIHNITINGLQPQFSFAPVENSTKELAITFNVSDGNGQADIVVSTIETTINFTNTVRKNSTGCITITTGLLDKYFNSTIYDLNVTVADAAGSRAENITEAAVTYTILTAIELSTYNLTFSTSPGS